MGFGWGNVGKVASDLRQRDGAARLVLAPDSDKEDAAAKIAADMGAAVAYMPQGVANNFDANDLPQRDGGDVLAASLESATEPPKPEPLLKPVSVFDVLTHPAPPPVLVWDAYLPRGVVALWGAQGAAVTAHAPSCRPWPW